MSILWGTVSTNGDNLSKMWSSKKSLEKLRALAATVASKYRGNVGKAIQDLLEKAIK